MEEKVIYPIKTLSQFPLVLKSFRKGKGLTQAAMAERLGITQQSYAHFEANPATAMLERIFMVLRMLDVEISLGQNSPDASKGVAPAVEGTAKRPATVKAAHQKTSKPSSAGVSRNARTSAVAKAGRIVAPTRKKESW